MPTRKRATCAARLASPKIIHSGVMAAGRIMVRRSLGANGCPEPIARYQSRTRRAARCRPIPAKDLEGLVGVPVKCSSLIVFEMRL